MIRFIRKFGTFKRPPPDYIFKRPVVKSDIDGSKIKQFPNYDVENEKWFDDEIKDKVKDKWGKSLYNGKYGSSLYGPQDDVYNDRQD